MDDIDKVFESLLPKWKGSDEKDPIKYQIAAWDFLENGKRKDLKNEILRLWRHEEVTEDTYEKFDKWTDQFFINKGLEHLIVEYHDYISECMDAEDEENT